MVRIFIVIIIFVMSISPISAKTTQNKSTQNNKKLFEKSNRFANEYNPEELYNLGVSYAFEQGVEKDLRKAKEFWLKSANMGYAKAQYNLGVMYHEGLAVKKNYQSALMWFKMAAKQNSPQSLYVIGTIYEKGEGVEKDIKKALGYYVLAANLKEKQALERIKKEPLLQQNIKLKKRGVSFAKKGDYLSAIKYFQKSSSILIRVLGEYHSSLLGNYDDIAAFYYKNKNYSKAIEYNKKALDLREKILEKEDINIAQNYSNIAGIYKTMENYPKAINFAYKSLEIRKKLLGVNHLVVANDYRNLAKIYYIIKDNSQAIYYYLKSLKIEEEKLGKTNIYITKTYNILCKLYESIKEYDKALIYQQKTLKIYKTTLGKENPDTTKSYYKIANLYFQNENYIQALTYYQKILPIFLKHIGEDHKLIAQLYTQLGNTYKVIGQYTNAIKYYNKTLSIQERTLGKEHSNTTVTYNNIALVYEKIGNYNKALNYLKRSLNIKKSIKGNDISIATSYHNLGVVYHDMGNYVKAIKNYQKSLNIKEKISGKKNINLAVTYNNIGLVYKDIGNYNKALVSLQKSLKIRENILGEKHSDTAQSYNNIALIYRKKGNYKKALIFYKKAFIIFEKILGNDHPNLSTVYNNIGMLYYKIKDFKNALNYLKQSQFILHQNVRSNHIYMAIVYNNLGIVYQTLKNYSESMVYFNKSLKIYKNNLNKEHPEIASLYENISSLYYNMKKYQKAYNNSKKAFDISLLNQDKIFTILDSQQKENYLKSTSSYIVSLLSTSYRYIQQLNKEGYTIKAQQILHSGANAWLNYKGSIFDSENTITTLYTSTKDQKLKQKIEDLIFSKRYLAKLYQSLPKPKEREVWKKRINETEMKIAKLSNDLASKADSLKQQKGLTSISYKNITSHLKEDELYIDYAKVARNYYLFTLDHKENITFIQIDQNSTKETDSLIKIFREDINMILKSQNLSEDQLKKITQHSRETLSRLYNLVIKKPLGGTIKNKTSLIISPDGALKLLPFETLYDKEKGKYLIEEKEIHYIPSGKELVRLYKYSKNKVSKEQKSAVIFANPNFNGKIASVGKEEIAITPNTNRSGIIKSLFRMRFNPLPGTKAEAEAIKKTLNKKSLLEYQDNKATEAVLMKVKEPNILHIATHGFFINDNTIPNPMLKSGIALAGANTSAIKGKSDGIVTALKLSGLDLKGTDLVVLSACETGVVDINSTDSVSGLSKAFIQAGAKDIIMSLWSVDDQATKELMTSFYQGMKKSKNYAEALKTAKLKMIEEGLHPFYWGAFIVNGL